MTWNSYGKKLKKPFYAVFIEKNAEIIKMLCRLHLVKINIKKKENCQNILSCNTFF